LAEVLVIIVKY